nr:S-crystallin like [Ipomoea batatas]GME09937.1 S-crystallin like [Ipomoea batatas]
MEGLIPLVYNAIVEYKSGRHGSPAVSYTRLPTSETGHLDTPDVEIFRRDRGFSPSVTTATKRRASTTVAQSPTGATGLLLVQ